MSFFDGVRYRVRVLLHPGQFARDRDDEIRHHLELEEIDIGATSDGRLSARELRAQARRRVGNVTYMHEERRMISGLTVFDAVRQDIRFLGRLMRRRLAFSVVTVLTIALGIGAATSIFSVADAVLFRPLAFADPNRLIAVWLTRPRWKTIPGQAKRWNHGELSFPMFRAWRASQTSFVDVAAWTSSTSIIGGETSPEEMVVGKATASLLSVLDVTPALGSWFSANDNTVGGSRVAVVSYEVWLARFGGDARALGQVVDVDNVRRTIIGVMPRGFTLDRGPVPIAYWIPVGQDAGETEDPGWFTYQALARLKPTVSLSAASLETSRTLGTSSEDNRVEGATLTTLHDDQTRTVRRPLLTLLGAAGLLLLIACINVATLLMGEAAARARRRASRRPSVAGRAESRGRRRRRVRPRARHRAHPNDSLRRDERCQSHGSWPRTRAAHARRVRGRALDGASRRGRIVGAKLRQVDVGRIPSVQSPGRRATVRMVSVHRQRAGARLLRRRDASPANRSGSRVGRGHDHPALLERIEQRLV
jgi:hypothetical protein